MSFILPPFIFHGLCDGLKDNGGEIWPMLHEMYEKHGNLIAMETL